MSDHFPRIIAQLSSACLFQIADQPIDRQDKAFAPRFDSIYMHLQYCPLLKTGAIHRLSRFQELT